ncbi:MAG: hypothetical protein WAO19_03435 [Candidatus Kryptoniota bacterium]
MTDTLERELVYEIFKGKSLPKYPQEDAGGVSILLVHQVESNASQAIYRRTKNEPLDF